MLLNFVFTAGTTWLIAASERSHKRSTNDQYLRNADQCLEMMKEMSHLWESARILADMFTRLVNEQREKRRDEEERWMITEIGPTGGGGASGSASTPPRSRRGGSQGITVLSDVNFESDDRVAPTGRTGNRNGNSVSSDEEGTVIHHPPQYHHGQSQLQQFVPHQQLYQPLPHVQSHGTRVVHHQLASQGIDPNWHAYHLPPLANPGPSGSSVLPSMHTVQSSTTSPVDACGPPVPLPAFTRQESSQPRYDDNDAINGLKRTGVWMNPPPP